MKLLVLLLLLLPVTSSAQDLLVPAWWWGTDSASCLYPQNIGHQDSLTCAMKPYSVVEWSLPYHITNESSVNAGSEGVWRDSIGIVASCPAGYTLNVCTGSTHHDMWLAGSKAGPFEYTTFWTPFETYPTNIQAHGAIYVMVQCVETNASKGSHGITDFSDYAHVDCAFLKAPMRASVPEIPDSSKASTFIDILGRPVAPSAVYKPLNASTALVP